MTISALILAALLGLPQVVTIDSKEMDLDDFFRFVASAANMNIVLHPAVQGKVNLMVKDAPLEQVLDFVLKNYGLRKEVEGNTMRIAPAAAFQAEQAQTAALEEARLSALPLQTQIYVLNYAKAHLAFPHESTANQWFTEAQFESYRALGYRSVEAAVAFGIDRFVGPSPQVESASVGRHA